MNRIVYIVGFVNFAFGLVALASACSLASPVSLPVASLLSPFACFADP